MKRSRQIGLGVAAIVLGAALAASVGASAPKFSSHVHMHGVDPQVENWVGDVHSPMRKCQRGRTVTVIYQEAPEPEKVGSDITDRRGHWQIPVAVPGDDPYYAKVAREVIGTGDNKIVCKADRSPGFGFPPF